MTGVLSRNAENSVDHISTDCDLSRLETTGLAVVVDLESPASNVPHGFTERNDR